MARILAIDAGTTGVRAILFGSDGKRLGSAYCELTTRYPRPGWVEQDPDEIWLNTLAVVGQAFRSAGIAPRDVAAVGLTNQRSSIVAWDSASGQPLSSLISWQDTRAAARAAALQEAGFFVTPNVAVSKAEWLVRNTPGARDAARAGRLRLGGMESWLIFKLSNGAHVSDHANASATGFYAHLEGTWDKKLLEAVDIAESCLPELVDCAGNLAVTDSRAFGAAVPIAGLCGDQQAALYGLACETAGATKCSYGTSAMVDAASGLNIALGGPGTYPLLAWRLPGRESPTWCVEGNVITAGAAVQWLRDALGVIECAADVEPLATSVADSGGVWMVPALQGLGTPFADSRARGLIGGLTRGSGPGQIARALLEGIAHRVCDVAETVWMGTGRADALRVDGGASSNDLLMQLQADFLGVPVERGSEPDASALGVARLAALGVGASAGMWGEWSWAPVRVFEPGLSTDELGAARSRWQRRLQLAAEAES